MRSEEKKWKVIRRNGKKEEVWGSNKMWGQFMGSGWKELEGIGRNGMKWKEWKGMGS